MLDNNPTNRAIHTISGLSLGFFIWLLAGCGLVPKGTPVCVGGFGQCGTSINPTSAGGLTLSASSTTINVRQTATLTAVGGTAPYTFAVASGGVGTVANITGSTTTATYTPPSTLTTSPTNVIINLTDSENPSVTVTTTIAVSTN